MASLTATLAALAEEGTAPCSPRSGEKKSQASGEGKENNMDSSRIRKRPRTTGGGEASQW